MNLGIFGGTFDPIHLGHTAMARVAAERFALSRVYFVPASVPPHKQQPFASYFDRFAMLALATSGEKGLVPSTLEAPSTRDDVVSGKKSSAASAVARGVASSDSPRVNYSVDTVRRLRETLKKSDRLFFLIGIDAFRDIAKWHEAEALLGECEFVVSSRPGYSLAEVANALPERLRPDAGVTKPFAKHPAKGDLVLAGVTLHLLDEIQHPASATAVRSAVAAKKPLGRLVHPAVAEYIKKRELYLK